MEVVLRRLFVFAAVIAALAVAVQIKPPAPAPLFSNKDEAWMEKNLPTTVDGWLFQGSPSLPNQSYKSDQSTYDKLKPIGIVSRIFREGNKTVDTQAVAGKDLSLLHDPGYCFPFQGWTIESQSQRTIDLGQTPGKARVSIWRVRKNDERFTILFTFASKRGYVPMLKDLQKGGLLGFMRGSSAEECAYYRFMTGDGSMSEDELIAFAVKYLNESKIINFAS